MRLNSLHYCLAFLLAIVHCGCLGAPAQTNQVASLLATNGSGQHRLVPAWVGTCTQTVATGSFITHSNTLAQAASVEAIHFDLFCFLQKASALPLGSCTISQILEQTKGGWSHSNIYVHRTSFPTDAALKQARTIGELRNLLGLSGMGTDAWGVSGGEMHSGDVWWYFRLKDGNTLETLKVACLTTYTEGQPEEYVDSLRIMRGTAKPER